MQVMAHILLFLDNHLCSIADHEVLLIDTKQLSFLIGIIRIQEQCQILFDVFFIKIDTVLHNGLIHRIEIKEVQFGMTLAKSDDIHVIHTGIDGFFTKLNRECNICLCQPAMFGQPAVRDLHLTVLMELLFE